MQEQLAGSREPPVHSERVSMRALKPESELMCSESSSDGSKDGDIKELCVGRDQQLKGGDPVVGSVEQRTIGVAMLEGNGYAAARPSEMRTGAKKTPKRGHQGENLVILRIFCTPLAVHHLRVCTL